MAWVAFQQANRLKAASAPQKQQYFPASIQSTVTGNLTFAASAIKTLTLTAAFGFDGNAPVIVTAPFGNSGYATAAAQGLMIDNAWLQGPASGSAAAGNHPLILVNLSASVALTTAATGFDLIATQW